MDLIVSLRKELGLRGHVACGGVPHSCLEIPTNTAPGLARKNNSVGGCGVIATHIQVEV